MREIRTSGLMSGEGKRSDANAVQTTAPFLDSTEDVEVISDVSPVAALIGY